MIFQPIATPRRLRRSASLTAEALIAVTLLSLVVIAVGSYCVQMHRLRQQQRLRHDALTRASWVMEQLMAVPGESVQQTAEKILDDARQNQTPPSAPQRFDLSIDFDSQSLAGISGKRVWVRVNAAGGSKKQLAALEGWVPES